MDICFCIGLAHLRPHRPNHQLLPETLASGMNKLSLLIPIVFRLGPPPEPDEKTKKLFTDHELRQIHFRSGHPHWRRMANFLQRVQPDRCPPDVRKQLQRIAGACKA